MDHILKPKLIQVYDREIQDKLRKNFYRIERDCYLDHAGATLYSNPQIEAVFKDLSSAIYANPHSAASAGNQSQEIIERTRYRILDFFHASSEEYSLVFTSSATFALKCIAESFAFEPTSDFVHLQDNHTSVLGMRDVVAQKGARISCLTRDTAFALFSKANRQLGDLKPTPKNKSLFVYSAQCNFSGFKYPLQWIESTHAGTLNELTGQESSWYVLLDAASFVGTSPLDLSIYKPDFVAVSFYKMLGYPTGIGGLIVRNSSAAALEKVYYGGGTVNMALSTKNYHVKRGLFHQRFEDGTLPFLSIISLQHGLDAISFVPMLKISSHVFALAQFLYYHLLTLHHSNEKPLVKLYADSDYKDQSVQGGVVTFNVIRSSGKYIGYMEVLHMAALFKIHLRTGCFCNPGACQRHLGLSNDDIMKNYDAGFTCGGGKDLLNGKPTGAIRISFGYMSTVEDIYTLLRMLTQCFLNRPQIVKIPQWFQDQLSNWKKQDNDKKSCEFNINREIKFNDNEQQELTSVAENGHSCDRVGLTVSRLFIYPVKSCAAFEVISSWIFGRKGLQYDREWMIVTSAGICLTQKQEPLMCLLKPMICLEKNIMKLEYPGMPGVQVPLELDDKAIISGKMCRTRVCGHRVEGFDCGMDISEWLSLIFGRSNLRLIRQRNSMELMNQMQPELSFSSQAQYLLVNDSSIRWLVQHIPDGSDCDKKTILERFRGNIIVSGAKEFDEDTWVRVKLGNYTFKVNGACTRCQMVCIDQTTGIKTIEPLRLLAEEFHGKIKFGIYLTGEFNEQGVISIGDCVSCVYPNIIL